MTLFEQIQIQVQQLPPEKQAEVLDFIAFLRQRVSSSHPNPAQRKENLRKALAALAELGTFAHITNPVEWQKHIRKDRPLPGRD
ncbi:MAG: hypothetical protein Kow0070_30490 [Anaerolineales bacterium]